MAALKAELDQRHQKEVGRFFEACAKGDIEVLRGFLLNDRSMARVSNPEAPHPGWTGLHAAAKSGHLQAVKLLLEHGADPNARETGDNTYGSPPINSTTYISSSNPGSSKQRKLHLLVSQGSIQESSLNRTLSTCSTGPASSAFAI